MCPFLQTKQFTSLFQGVLLANHTRRRTCSFGWGCIACTTLFLACLSVPHALYFQLFTVVPLRTAHQVFMRLQVAGGSVCISTLYLFESVT